jgi:hypothetical protein
VLRDLGLPMARHRDSGSHIPGFLWCGRFIPSLSTSRRDVDFFFFVICSVCDLIGDRLGPTSTLYHEQLASKRHTVGLFDRELEHRRHLDDLLSPPADASTLAERAQSRDDQDVHQYRHDGRRVLRALYYHRHRCSRHRGP